MGIVRNVYYNTTIMTLYIEAMLLLKLPHLLCSPYIAETLFVNMLINIIRLLQARVYVRIYGNTYLHTVAHPLLEYSHQDIHTGSFPQCWSTDTHIRQPVSHTHPDL